MDVIFDLLYRLSLVSTYVVAPLVLWYLFWDLKQVKRRDDDTADPASTE